MGQHIGGTKIVLKGPYGFTIEFALRLAFKITNNITKYEALSKGLDLAKEMKHRKLNVPNDSQLVIGQINSQFEIKEEKMAKNS